MYVHSEIDQDFDLCCQPHIHEQPKIMLVLDIKYQKNVHSAYGEKIQYLFLI